MGIKIGTQLLAPEGYFRLEKGCTYYFLKSDAGTKEALLVQFVVRPPRAIQTKDGKTKQVTPPPFPLLVKMSREQFEFGVLKNAIVVAEHQSTMPPWHGPLEGRNLLELEEHRRQPKRSHAERINAKLEQLYPLIRNAQEILRLENPDAELNRQARACSPKQNETKFRLGFYLFLVFGCNRNVLYYRIHRIGHWDRRDGNRAKLGAPSPYKGKGHGYNVSTEMREKIEYGYTEITKKKAAPITTIYQRTMTSVFKCKEITGSKGYKEYHHPNGEPFPRINQFRYHINQLIGKDHIRRKLIGKNKDRNEHLPSLGKFTESISNLLEKCEADGFYFEEVLVGYVDRESLPPFCMVRVRDYASGAIIGIGFAQNAERSSAYRMAYFCAAIDKVKFCALFGITIEPHQWIMIGVPLFLILDRGPGSSLDALAKEMEFKPAFRELSPSYSGQSKAVIESSHPKSVNNNDAPSHWQSDLTPIEMAKREIYRVLRDNDSINISERITPDLIDHVTQITPNGLWNALDKLGRNDGHNMSFSDAVRNFLTQVPVKIENDGIYLHRQRYDSDALRQTNLLNRVAEGQDVTIKAYVLDACVRHIWIEVDGNIIELDLQFALSAGSSVYFVSLARIKQIEDSLKEHESSLIEHRNVAASSAEKSFKENTGKDWDGGSRRSGRPKRGTPKARREAREADDMMRGRERS